MSAVVPPVEPAPRSWEAAAAREEPGDAARRHRAPELERVIVFADAVVAIALTLLVPDLRLPAGDYRTDASLQAALRALLPSFLRSRSASPSSRSGGGPTTGSPGRSIGTSVAVVFPAVLFPSVPIAYLVGPPRPS